MRVKTCKQGHIVTGDNAYTWSSGQVVCKQCAKRHHDSSLAKIKKEHPLFKRWQGMMSRCEYAKHKKYENYGGRGITVCDEWKVFANFERDMSPRPPGTSLDRIDNNGPYCKDNCRWSTNKQQIRNRRNTVFGTLRGETKPVTEWAEILCINAHTLLRRIKAGHPLDMPKMHKYYPRRDITKGTV